MTRRVTCPVCRTTVSRENPLLPFCSERCRLLDLGRWLEGDYRVAGEKAVEEEVEAQEQDRDGDAETEE